MLISYDLAPSPVRDDLAAAHDRFWRRLAVPGAWWTGADRVAIARETRSARRCELCARRKQALSPYHLDGVHERASDLPEVAVDAAHRIVTDASRLTRVWLDRAVAQGLTVESYVELLGTVVAMVSIDSFCLAIGAPEHPLPSPEPGAPNRYRPASARQEEAWVPVVPEDNAGTPEADLWPARRTGWVIRAMSLVPDEVRTLNDLGEVHYLRMEDVSNPRASRGRLTRPKMWSWWRAACRPSTTASTEPPPTPEVRGDLLSKPLLISGGPDRGLACPAVSDHSSALQELDDEHDQRDHQQDVDDASERVPTDEPEGPQNQKHQQDSPQHHDSPFRLNPVALI